MRIFSLFTFSLFAFNSLSYFILLIVAVRKVDISYEDATLVYLADFMQFSRKRIAIFASIL